jgi:GNAT superfamily N-acetyltransferase
VEAACGPRFRKAALGLVPESEGWGVGAMLVRMAVAWVGDDGAGGFWAHVEYDEPSPFRLMNGPGPASVAEAVAWARSRAQKVYVRVGGRVGQRRRGSRARPPDMG